jgi:hypothetical protein
MRADSTLRPTKHPRGVILSTGEDVPVGHSLRARCIVTEMRAGDVNSTKLSELQQLAADGWLAQALAAYVSWLAPQLEARQREAIDLARSWRKKSFTHRRTTDAIGALAAGEALYLRFAVEVGAIAEDEAGELIDAIEAALLQVGADQAALHASEDPVRRFLELLTAGLGVDAHLESADSAGEPPGLGLATEAAFGWRRRTVGVGEHATDQLFPQGDRVGWVRGDHLYLEPEVAYRVGNRLAASQGASLGVSPRTLWRRLGERKLLVASEEGRHTDRPYIQGRRRRVLHLLLSSLLSPTIGPNGPAGPEDRADAREDSAGPDLGAPWAHSGNATGHTSGPQTPPENDAGESLGDSGPLGPRVPFTGEETAGVPNEGDKEVLDL